MVTAELPLTRGKVALLDDADLERVHTSRWHAFPIGWSWYAARYDQGRRLYLHRFVLDAPPGLQVDHINGDGLDNRRANLRLATHRQNHANQRKNCANTSGYRGVTWFARDGRWKAQARVYDRVVHLGYFDDPREAALARDAFMRALHGPYAALNFPGESIAAYHVP